MVRGIHTNIYKLLVVTLAVLAVLVISGNAAHAQEEQAEEETNYTYEYTAQPGDSLTKLVRRSIQLFDERQEEVELTPAQVVFMETNIQRELGSQRLRIGQPVSVPENLITKYITQAQELSEAQQANWSTYADKATFELSNITPTSDPVAQARPVDDVVDDNLPDTEPTQSSESTQWYWWVLGTAAVICLWYLLWRRAQESDNETT